MQINSFFQQSTTHQNSTLTLNIQSNEVKKPQENQILAFDNKQSSNHRLEQAMNLFSNKSLNISEIAYSVGFNDPKYFSRCFKRKYGLTPKEYRELKFKHIRFTNELNFDENFIAKATDIVQENISIPAFGVDELASELNMSYSTLYRKIKSISGISPCDFIRKARIKNAINMLSQKTLSFADIAFASGFCNYSYFSRCFRSEFGIFPSEYIQKLKMG